MHSLSINFFYSLVLYKQIERHIFLGLTSTETIDESKANTVIQFDFVVYWMDIFRGIFMT